MAELNALKDVLIVLAVAVLVVSLLRRIHVPIIAGFILSGIIIGPWGLGLVSGLHEVHILAEVGIALLLFGIGLELQLSRVRRLWRLILLGGGLQVGLTAAVFALIAYGFDLPARTSIFVGLIVALSSTAIVLRALSSRSETEAPHGRFTLSVLVFQDLCVVPILLAIPLLAGTGNADAGLADSLLALAKTVGGLAVILAAAWFLVPRILQWIAMSRQRELFVLTVLVICLGIAYLISTLGISLALGAFLAGLLVSGSEYRHQALTELIPLREVLTSLFFISVGMLLDLDWLVGHAGAVAGITALVFFGKFALVFLVTTIMRLPLRVCVLSAVALAQLGEFGFVLIYAADGTGLLTGGIEEALSATAIITMIITPAALAAGPKLAAGAGRIPGLGQLYGVPQTSECLQTEMVLQDHVIIAGYGVAGQELSQALRAMEAPYVIVDLNAENVRAASAQGEPIYFGDITSAEVLHHVGAPSASQVVVAVNDPAAAERATRTVRSVAPHAHLVVRTRYLLDIEELIRAGANEVVTAEIEAAVELTARVLSRQGSSSEAIREHQARIRARTDDLETRR